MISLPDSETILAISLSPSSWFHARSVAVILWIGLAILTVALIVLARTKWGHARPVYKCIILSVFAHFLLFGYAYGTKLFLAVPVDHPTTPIDVEWVEETEIEELIRESEEQFSQAPWDPNSGDGGIEPSIDSPDATVAESEIDDAHQLASNASSTNFADHQHEHLSNPSVERSSTQDLVERPEIGSLQPIRVETQIVPQDPVDIAQDQPRAIAEEVEHAGGIDQQINLNSEPVFAGILDEQSDLLASGPGELSFDPVLEQRAESMLNRTRELPLPDLGLDRMPSLNDVDDHQLPAEDVSPAQLTSAQPTHDIPRLRDEQVDEIIRTQRQRLGDGRPLPQPYRLRRADLRTDIAMTRGGTLETEQAVENALAWFARIQEANGRWDSSRHEGGRAEPDEVHDRGDAGASADMGVTGLALLAFLSAGHTQFEGEYRDNVRHGLEYLVRTQAADGNLYGDASLYARMYCHGMALLAISEAYGMTGDFRLLDALERGVQYTIDSQHQGSGGWRYQPGDLGDISQFGWQVMALKSARLAGIEIPVETSDLMWTFLESCSSGNANGLAAYRPNEQPTPTMTAEALVCRLLLDDSIRAETVMEAHRATSDALVEIEGRPINFYLIYYGTLSMFLAPDDAWSAWNPAMQHLLLTRQRTDGVNRGSWDPDSVWGPYGGRVYSTALATLSLEVYYRYLPMFQSERIALIEDQLPQTR